MVGRAGRSRLALRELDLAGGLADLRPQQEVVALGLPVVADLGRRLDGERAGYVAVPGLEAPLEQQLADPGPDLRDRLFIDVLPGRVLDERGPGFARDKPRASGGRGDECREQESSHLDHRCPPSCSVWIRGSRASSKAATAPPV